MALVTLSWGVLMFVVLTLWGVRIIDAVVFTVLAQVSASAMFWFAVPDLFAFGSVTILVSLLLTLWPRPISEFVRHVCAVVSAMSMSITNVSIALVAALTRLRVRDVWLVGVHAWFWISLLWGFQKLWFPEAVFFLVPQGSWEAGSDYVATWSFVPDMTRLLQVSQALLFHSVIMPEITVLSGAEIPALFAPVASKMMTVQASLVGSSGVSGAIATVAWALLLGLGVWSLWLKRSGFGTICAAALFVQWAFHMVFGWETFLYVIHVLPMLVVVAAAGTLTRFRLPVLVLALTVIAFGGRNNWHQFRIAAEVVSALDAEALAVQSGQKLDR